jgi:UDP-glucose 4-epimerase
MKRLRLTAAGPEQVTFLRYRPVLANAALKQDFGFIPTKTSREVFESYWAAHLRSGNGRS